jgi:hypothetical protein
METPELPFPFSLFLKYFWLLAIGATCFNAYILKVRSQKYIQADPSLEDDYDKLFRGYIVYLNIPWVVMGIGIMFGNIPTVFDFLSAGRSSNIFIMLFWGSIILLWGLLFIWTYFLGCAEFLIAHPGLLRGNIKSPLLIKFYVATSVVGGIYLLYFLWNMGLK